MPADTVYKFTLSKENLDIIKATLPAVAAAGPDFTKEFYARLFTSTPALKGVFNQTNQAKGKQPEKLFKTLAVAATCALDTGELPGEAVEPILQKHIALDLSYEPYYDAVGATLLETIKDMLTSEQAHLDAWGALYTDIKTVFMTREKEIMDEMEKTPGGWRGKRKFRISRKEMASDIVCRITFHPVDEKPVPEWVAGKYITVWVDNLKGVTGKYGEYTSQPRHYTLAKPIHDPEIDATKNFKISVKKEPNGLVSNILHDALVGDEFDLTAPFGAFDMSGAEKLWLTEDNVDIVFLSAGVGITPVLAMLENIYTTRGATWLHANQDGNTHAYRDRLRFIASVRSGDMQRRVWYSNPSPEDGEPGGEDNSAKYHYKGFMDLNQVKELIHVDNPNTQFFMCGPPPFMDAQIAALKELGVAESSIHYEGF